jgi:predicted nucleic acid-binding protein
MSEPTRGKHTTFRTIEPKILYFGTPVAIVSSLNEDGTPIPTNDLWIAALVLQHDLVLCTSDSHFDKLPQIARA